MSTSLCPSYAAAFSTATSDDPAAFERANYLHLRTLHSWTTPPSLVPGPPPG